MAETAGERTEDATPKRKLEARKKGTVAKSTDLTGAITLLAAAMAMPMFARLVGEGALTSFSRTVSEAPQGLAPNQILGFTGSIASPWIGAMLGVFAVLVVAGLAANFGQVGFFLSAEPMSPKLEKINPAAGFKRIFSRRGLMEGVKALAKLAIFSMIAYGAVSNDWPRLVGLAWLHPTQAVQSIAAILHSIMLRIALVWLIIAAVDYFFQRKEVEKQLKMTKTELKQEMKEQEGSPEVKSAQSQKRRQLLKGGLAKKLKEADVLITNPTHFAVAVKYQRNSMHAPMVLAKGQDFLALKMREIAGQLDVPIVENKPLARALYKQCEPGDFIPRDLFGPVAEVLAYVYKTVEARRGRKAS